MGQHPRDYNWTERPEGCPFLQMIEGIWIQKEDNDFGPGTLIEIGDVANLIKALFKVNVHIAHDEYYLR